MASTRRTRQASRASSLARKQANWVAPGDGPEPEVTRKKRRRKTQADPADRLVRRLASWFGTMPLASAEALQEALTPSDGWEGVPGMVSVQAVVQQAISKRARRQRSDYTAREAALRELRAYFSGLPSEVRRETQRRAAAALSRGGEPDDEQVLRDVERILRD